jgi:hypothetical protein
MLTAACVFLGWLAWQLSIVRERRMVRAEMEARYAPRWPRRDRFEYIAFDPVQCAYSTWQPSPMPFPRNWFGDMEVGVIEIVGEFPGNEEERIRRAFPEARIKRSH